MELLFTMEKIWYYKKTVVHVLWKKNLCYVIYRKDRLTREKKHGRLPKSIL